MGDQRLSRFGKNFLIEPSGTELTSDEQKLLERLRPSAIMFRKRNFLQNSDYKTWLRAYERLLAQCREVLQHDSLMIAIDHEGGRVVRPPDPITKFPYAARWGSAVEDVAEAMAIELKSIGVNVNFAPVADIHSNPENPVINERAFGRTSDEVSHAAIRFACNLQAHGVAPCAKHFPGHGDTKIDSHWGVPALNLTLEELRCRELVPFQSLVNVNVPIVMTAHILFPKIDPDNKATLSRKFLNDILREEMGFLGVIIADALGMAPTASILQQRETVVKAINAGLDIFLVAGDNVSIADAVKMAELLHEALENGEISERALQSSQQRIDAFINKLPQHPVMELSADVFERHHALAERLHACSPWSGFQLSLPGFE
jgi:beta-N-acetylhexosaminidase